MSTGAAPPGEAAPRTDAAPAAHPLTARRTVRRDAPHGEPVTPERDTPHGQTAPPERGAPQHQPAPQGQSVRRGRPSPPGQAIPREHPAPPVAATWRLHRAILAAGLHPAVQAAVSRDLDAIDRALVTPCGDVATAAGRLERVRTLLGLAGSSERGVPDLTGLLGDLERALALHSRRPAAGAG